MKGSLLVASPALHDPNFRRTVVLVTEHTDEGAMGLVLNRSSTAAVVDAVPALEVLAPDDDLVRIGGPVETGAVVVLLEFDEPDDAAAIVLGDVGFLPAEADPDELVGRTRRIRAFAGYAGWGAGQLEGELEEEAWIVAPALPDDVFSPEEDTLWSTILRRKGGRYRLVAMMPLDPSVN